MGQTSTPAPTDVFAGDARLAARRTVEAGSARLDKLLSGLNEQTGIDFVAEPSVAVDHVILFAHDRPLGDTLRELAAFFRFTWRRESTAAGPRCVLGASETSRLSDKPNYSPATLRAAEQILADLRAATLLEELPAAEIERRQSELKEAIKLVEGSSLLLPLDNELRLITAWNEGGVRLATQALRGHTREELAELLLAGIDERYYFDTSARSKKPKYVTPALAKDIRSGAMSDSAAWRRSVSPVLPRPNPAPGELTYARMIVQEHRSLFPAMTLQFLVATPSDRFGAGMVTLPVNYNVPEAPAQIGPTEVEIAALPYLSRLLFSQGELPKMGRGGDARNLTQICEMLSTLHSANVIADDFASGMLLLVSRSCADTLNSVAMSFGLTWRIHNGFVLLTSRSHDADRWEAHHAPSRGDLKRFAP